MRIVAGRLRGRTIAGPTDDSIRPTSDRLRETIFNILAHAYDDAIADAAIIDLFAGTGAMGFEALSRGARRALFVDDAANARALLRANVDALGLGGETRIFRRDARKLGDAPPGEQFSIAFLDPPYGQHLGEQALMALRDGRWLTPERSGGLRGKPRLGNRNAKRLSPARNTRLWRHENSVRARGQLNGSFLDEGL